MYVVCFTLEIYSLIFLFFIFIVRFVSYEQILV
jgi:hypothetical protein